MAMRRRITSESGGGPPDCPRFLVACSIDHHEVLIPTTAAITAFPGHAAAVLPQRCSGRRRGAPAARPPAAAMRPNPVIVAAVSGIPAVPVISAAGHTVLRIPMAQPLPAQYVGHASPGQQPR
jgi:hypothetical protein